jgi:hypothetical protein
MKEKIYKKTPWPESTSELYRPSDRRLSAKVVSTVADIGCHVVSVTDPYGRILWFLGRSPYFIFQVAPQLYSRGWVDPVPDQLLLRKFGCARNGTRTSGSVARTTRPQRRPEIWVRFQVYVLRRVEEVPGTSAPRKVQLLKVSVFHLPEEFFMKSLYPY